MMDLQRGRYFPVPHALGDIWDRLINQPVSAEDAVSEMNEDQRIIMDEYVSFLRDIEAVSFVSKALWDILPRIEPDSLYPGHIADVIATIHPDKAYDAPHILKLAEILGARHVLLNIDEGAWEIADEIIKGLKDSSFRSITLLFDQVREDVPPDLFSGWVANTRILQILVQGPIQIETSGKVTNVPQGWFAQRHTPSPTKMICGLNYYAEARTWNTSFHLRLFVSRSGSLHSGWCDPIEQAFAAEMQDEITMKGLILSARFGTLSKAVKSRTDVCRDCEFRNMCLDGRAPVQRSNADTWLHLSECPYNPYICKWKGEEGYRTLAECGVVSNAEGFSIDHERIAAINAELWGE